MATKPRGLTWMTWATAVRTRDSSRASWTTQIRNNWRASRRACLEIFISRSQLAAGFLGQTLLVFGREDFADDVGTDLDDEVADFAFEFGQHAGALESGGFAGLGDD